MWVGLLCKPSLLVVKQLFLYQLHKIFLGFGVTPLFSSAAGDKWKNGMASLHLATPFFLVPWQRKLPDLLLASVPALVTLCLSAILSLVIFHCFVLLTEVAEGKQIFNLKSSGGCLKSVSRDLCQHIQN